MKGSLGNLRVFLGVDDREFRRALGDNGKRLQAFGRQVAIAGAAAGAAAAGGLAALGAQSLRAIDEQAKLARDLNTTTASLQVMERAGELSGVSLGSIAQATKDLTRRLSQAADGAGPAVTALQRLGFTAEELMAMPLDERIDAINGAIREFVPAAAQAAVAGQLFGEEGSIAMSRIDSAAIRTATADLERFGVAVSEQDAGQIERTNDALSRMSLITTGIGNQVAVAVAPALERMADAFSAIAQVGGPLNSAIGLIVGNLDRIAAYAGVAAAAFGTIFVAGLVASAAATVTLSGALVALRAAIIRTGIGALIVGAGELVLWFQRLVERVGGFGEAMVLLGDVAWEVLDRIANGFAIIPAAMQTGGMLMRSIFLRALAKMASAFADFTQDIANGLNALFKTNLSGIGSGLASQLNTDAAVAVESAAASIATTRKLRIYVTSSLDSLSALRAATENLGNETEGAAESVERMNSALTQIGGSGGGGSGGGGSGSGAGGGTAGHAAAGLSQVAVAADEVSDSARTIEDAFRNTFRGIITGAESGRTALGNLLSSLANVWADQAFKMLWSGGGGFGGIGAAVTSAVMPAVPSFEGGGVTPNIPRSGGLDGRGGFLAMLHGNEIVTDTTRGQSGALRLEASPLTLTDDGTIMAQVRAMDARTRVGAVGDVRARMAKDPRFGGR